MPQTALIAPSGSSRRVTFAACSAVLIITGILGSLYILLLYIQGHMHKQPFLMLLLPPVTAISIAIVIPMFMFISFQDDFKNLNPANPVHFFSICKRCYAAVARNNMKVSEKDL